MKIVTIIGARPQFIKAATVSREIKKHPNIKEVIIHTGQHFDANMSEVFFNEMQIPKPDYNLDINSLSHGAMTGRMLEGIEKVLIKEKPDWVLVYGDTNSTIAGALAAKKLSIKVAHVEAGLRSFNMEMPEEINRILTDRISDKLFCPTDTAIKNLKNEGFKNINAEIVNSGDVMYDAALFYSKFNKKSDKVENLISGKNFILCTIHREENTNNILNIKSIFEALIEISNETEIIIPLHPRTKKIIDNNNILISDRIKIIDPVGYFDMIYLLKNCSLVMTDSGGLQKEAYFFEKMCITLREETEWVELVENGSNYIVGANKLKIIETYKSNKSKEIDFVKNLYGDGQAARIIVGNIIK
jgi:UDP-GlcNAc3NAcA epimerase